LLLGDKKLGEGGKISLTPSLLSSPLLSLISTKLIISAKLQRACFVSEREREREREECYLYK
jgi:hypothetical protein